MRAGWRAAGVLVLGVALPAAAADWSFDPVVTLQLQRRSNPTLTAFTETGTDSAALAVRLSETMTGPRAHTLFAYEPTATWYRTNSQLNDVTHHAALEWGFRGSTLTQWTAAANWTRSDRPRFTYDNPENAPIVVPANKQTTLQAFIGAAFTLAPRTHLTVTVRHMDRTYGFSVVDPTAEAGPAAEALAEAKSKENGLALALSHSLTPLDSWVVSYEGSAVDEGEFGRRTFHRLTAGWTRASADRYSFSVLLGANKTQVRETGALGSNEAPTGFAGIVTYNHRISLRGDFSIAASREQSASGGVVGPATTSSINATLRERVGAYSTVSGYASWSRYEPIGQTPVDAALRLGNTTTRALKAEWALSINPRWYVVTSGEYVKQNTEFVGAFNITYSILSVGIRWAPTAARMLTQPPASHR